MKTVIKNQAHPVAEKSNLRKVLFKNSSGSSMVLFKNVDVVNASIRVNALKRLYSDWRGEFIIVR